MPTEQDIIRLSKTMTAHSPLERLYQVYQSSTTCVGGTARRMYNLQLRSDQSEVRRRFLLTHDCPTRLNGSLLILYCRSDCFFNDVAIGTFYKTVLRTGTGTGTTNSSEQSLPSVHLSEHNGSSLELSFDLSSLFHSRCTLRDELYKQDAAPRLCEIPEYTVSYGVKV